MNLVNTRVPKDGKIRIESDPSKITFPSIPMGDTANENFWTTFCRYGAIHRCQPDASGQNQDHRCLLVFVHGLFGDSCRTWGQMPKWVLENAELDLTAISFSYPSRPWHRCSIVQAADDLKSWLETEFREYPHVLFVTHSTGGLVVKTLLVNAANEHQAKRSNLATPPQTDSLWIRTRRVLNISVPHFGGSAVVSRGGKWLYQSYYFCLAPVFAFARFLSQGNRDWGKNQIIPALAWGNPQLLELENEYVARLRQSRDSNEIAPVVQDIGAKSDLSVPYTIEESSQHVFIRGTHKSIKIPRRVDAPIVFISAELLRRYGGNPGLDLVRFALSRISLVNRTLGTERLIGSVATDSEFEQIAPSILSSMAGTQQEVTERIIATVQRGGLHPRKLLVTGAAGVGKSSVLRHISAKLGLNYLDRPGTATPLPLLIPMQQITVSEPGDSTYTWDMMWQWWLNWGKSLHPEANCSREWLEDQFRNNSVVVILDGLDDFLQNHKSVGFSSIVQLLRETEARYVDNANLSIVIGIRNTLQGIDRLVDHPRDIHEIQHLTVAQAKKIYPSCQQWIESIEDPELMEFILTPLILSNYEPDPSCPISEGAHSQSALLCQSIRTLLSRSGLVRTQIEDREIELEHLGRAMMVIAWLFFSKARGETSIVVLQREAVQFHQRWSTFFAAQERDHESFYLESLAPEKDDILFGFSLAGNPRICENLLQRSLFVPTSSGVVRFRHRHWQEFLLGQYLSLCIRTRNFEELGIAAFHTRIYRIAGESFGDRMLTENGVKALFQNWSKSHNEIIVGNLSGFLTWTQTSIEPGAVRFLVDKLEELEPLSRLVLVGGLVYRVLVDHPNDSSKTDIRRALLPRIQELAHPKSSTTDNCAQCSLSWMYLKAFSELSSQKQTPVDWPGLDFKDDQTLKVLPMVCSTENGNYVLDQRSKSLQASFLVSIMETFNDARLAIRAVHYLYYLIVARKHDVHFAGLSSELPVLLAEGCEFEAIIKSFDSVPELLTFYRRCQHYHGVLESANKHYKASP